MGVWVDRWRNVTKSGPDQNRTDDLFHAMEALYQLSYGPEETMLTGGLSAVPRLTNC